MGINIAERDFVILWILLDCIYVGMTNNDLGSFSRQQAVCQFAATLHIAWMCLK